MFTNSTQPFDIRFFGAIKGGGLAVHEEIDAQREKLGRNGFRPPKTAAEHQRLVRFYTDQSERHVHIPFSKRGTSPSRVARSLKAVERNGKATFGAVLRSSSSAPGNLRIPALTLADSLPESMRDAIPGEGLHVTPRRAVGPQISFSRSQRF